MRKVLAALFVVAALATASGALPGVIQNVVYACDAPSCSYRSRSLAAY